MTANGAAHAAFFDVDGTLINVRSLSSFLDFARSALGWDRQPWFPPYYAELRRLVVEAAPRATLNAFYYTAFRGQRADAVAELGRAWFRSVSGGPAFYNELAVEKLRRHQAQGARIVLVTGSFLPVVAPLAEALACDDVLCTRLEQTDGVYTGRLRGAPCIGEGKAAELARFAAESGVSLAASVAYGDDQTDAPMLAAVGAGHWVECAPAYREEVGRRDWRVNADTNAGTDRAVQP